MVNAQTLITTRHGLLLAFRRVLLVSRSSVFAFFANFALISGKWAPLTGRNLLRFEKFLNVVHIFRPMSRAVRKSLLLEWVCRASSGAVTSLWSSAVTHTGRTESRLKIALRPLGATHYSRPRKGRLWVGSCPQETVRQEAAPASGADEL